MSVLAVSLQFCQWGNGAKTNCTAGLHTVYTPHTAAPQMLKCHSLWADATTSSLGYVMSSCDVAYAPLSMRILRLREDARSCCPLLLRLLWLPTVYCNLFFWQGKQLSPKTILKKISVYMCLNMSVQTIQYDFVMYTGCPIALDFIAVTHGEFLMYGRTDWLFKIKRPTFWTESITGIFRPVHNSPMLSCHFLSSGAFCFFFNLSIIDRACYARRLLVTTLANRMGYIYILADKKYSALKCN